ncbi:ATP-binding cassette domain-containing protein [Corallincola luteus]|uniref:ATP-binding cassette domain-containing protein n=1 Tax=Corallincola luteus TaxID=1775177 RepID=A0ABY2AHH5_9GAMM|nr:ABC transporter transmembrane domain-containing protein [Corallincola luteus]TCI02047.1 ATP-binding cassette domain-containing protein [Corallincola luteus]
MLDRVTSRPFPLIKQAKGFSQAALASVVINILSLALPLTMLQIFDRILPNQSLGTATVLVVSVAIAILLETLLRFARSWVLAASASHFELSATINTSQALMDADYQQIEQLGTGRIFSGLSSIATVRDLYSGQAALAIMDFPFVVIFLVLVAYIGGVLVFIPLAVWLVVGLIVWLLGKKLYQVTNTVALSNSQRTRMLMHVLIGISTAKALALETKLASKYRELNHQRLAQQQQVDWLASRLQEIIQGASQGTTLLLVLVGCLAVLNGELTSGGLAACSILAGRAVAPLSAIISLRSRLVAAKSAMTSVDTIVNLPSSHFTGTHTYQAKLPAPFIKLCQLSAKRVCAHLDHVSLTIPANRLTVVRSDPLTHASLLLTTIGGLQKPCEGDIYFNEIPQYHHNQNEFSQSVLYVSSWPPLFDGSLIDNMTMFNPELAPEAMKLADDLGLTTTISRLNNGYQTPVGEGADTRLSQGAIKLIAMVRALVQKPSLLLLDEPLVSLDIDGQNRLVTLLKQMTPEMTVVASSHNPSLIVQCDAQIEIGSSGHAHLSQQEGA